MRAFILLLAAGCATGAATNQTVTFPSASNHVGPPITVSVGKGHVVGGQLNAWLDEGCVHGNMGRLPVQFCRDDKGDKPGEQHWSGASGEFTVRPSLDGHQVDVDGYWQLDSRRMVSMTQTLPLGTGQQWDELRRNPALLAVAATAAELQGAGIARR